MLLLRECGFTQVSVTKKSGDGGIDGTGKLRINGILDIEEVEFALLENSGDLSVIGKSKCQKARLLWIW